jgi:hypothetical protein
MSTTTFHRNLNATNGNRWSYKQPGERTVQAQVIYASNVTVKQPSGKSFENCLNGGNRSVFAWFKTQGELHLNENAPAMPEHAQRVRFNPKHGEKFFSINGERVDAMHHVWCTANGECFAIV